MKTMIIMTSPSLSLASSENKESGFGRSFRYLETIFLMEENSLCRRTSKKPLSVII
jgi:hypothetical protein